jgi:predicted GIY-YIG superfamily endonuclease
MKLHDLMQLTSEERLKVLNKLREDNGEIPPEFKIIYDIAEEYRIEKLPKEERLMIFNNSKEEWKQLYHDFKRISDIMENYKTNEMLVAYLKQSPPPFIQDKAIEVYKKCLSFKVKLTNTKIKKLVHYHTPGPFCIDGNLVKNFISEYQSWNRKLYELWNENYYLKQDFFFNSGYKHNWKFYIKRNNLLKDKADEIQKIQENVISLLNVGQALVFKYDKAVTLEYERNSHEMSLFEREEEIWRICENENVGDEEYCYVYTLECELCIFYVGIASNPKERFEQHYRGAFSDESHLFKSKFIQKYHNHVKQQIIYEGTRKECKKFEREYIAEFSPLGNMTDGGEG